MKWRSHICNISNIGSNSDIIVVIEVVLLVMLVVMVGTLVEMVV